MFRPKKLLRYSSYVLVSVMTLAPIYSFSQKKTQIHNATSATSTKTVKLVQTHRSTELETNSGDVVSLPAYRQVLVNRGDILPNNLLASADLTISSELLREKMIERQEMRELSDRLGVNIEDASMLDFYREAADWLGTRYRRGGMSRKAVDCSGFTNIIYKNVFGVQLDRVSTVIAKNVPQSITSKDDLEPGDMVFFSTFKKKYINHVGIYLGEGKFIHASIKKGVIVSRLDEGYYSTAWRKGGRI